MSDVSRTYISHGLVTIEALKEMGHTHSGASGPSIQTGQPKTVCSDVLLVNSIRFSSLLLMNG